MTTRPRRSPVVGVQQGRSRAWIRILVLALLLATVAAPAYGYYRVYVQPGNEWAARIGGEAVLTRGDVAERMQTVARLNQTSGDASSLGGNPYEVLRSMVEDELIRRAAARAGVPVTESDVDMALRDRFLPAGSGEAGANPEQLESEFREAYGRFLTRGRLSDEEYRNLVRVQLYREVLRQELAASIPPEAEQVEIAWIVLPRDFEETNAVFGLLEAGEPFENVARSLNTERYFTDPTTPGYVGWVPRGAFPQLDRYLFDASVGAGSLIGPVYSPDGIYIINVAGGPAVREVESDKMLGQLREESVRQWVQEEWQQQEVTLRFTSEDSTWVIDHVRDNLPASP